MPGQPLYCSGKLTGMSIEISNPNLDPLGYSKMFLNVRTDNQWNWISNKFNDLRKLGNCLPPRENRGTLMHDQRICLIFMTLFFLKC